MTTIERGAFENCVNMTMLDLSHNNITDFHPDTFDMNSYPGEFDLSYNFLTNLSRVRILFFSLKQTKIQNKRKIKKKTVNY